MGNSTYKVKVATFNYYRKHENAETQTTHRERKKKSNYLNTAITGVRTHFLSEGKKKKNRTQHTRSTNG